MQIITPRDSENVVIRLNKFYFNFFNSHEYERLFNIGYVKRINQDSFSVLSHLSLVVDEFNEWSSVFRDNEGKFTYLTFKPLGLQLKLLETRDGDVRVRDMNLNLDFNRFSSLFSRNTYWSVSRVRRDEETVLVYSLASGTIDEIETQFVKYCTFEDEETIDSTLDRVIEVDSSIGNSILEDTISQLRMMRKSSNLVLK